MDTPIWVWLGFLAFVLLLLAFDLGLLHRKQREIKVNEALCLSLVYFFLAAVFNAGVFRLRGEQAGWEFMTGYLIEKSLSLDNIFVFVLVFTHFAVPAVYQHRVLFWGILGALAMRGLMIGAGAALIAAFHWILYLFGAFLVATAIKMLLAADAKPDLSRNRVLNFVRSRFRVTDAYHDERFFIRRDGRLWATPLFLALVLIELTDLVFAVDSIPAIFAITQDPFIVYSSNVFAILGLRALYFALAAVVHRFHYLKYGLSLVLLVIGGKMLAADFYKLPTWTALAITATLIGGSILASLLRPVREAVPAGWIPGSPAQPEPVEETAVRPEERKAL
ncbi:MAG: TerC family protein [Pseudomonadota bacterium]